MENEGNPSPSAIASHGQLLKGMKLGSSSRFPVPMRGIIKAKIAQGFIRSVMASFSTTVHVSKDNDDTGTSGGESEDADAGDGTTGKSSAASTGMSNSPNYGNEK